VITARALLLYAVGATFYSRAATLTSVGDVSFISALPLVSGLGLMLRRVPATPRRIGCVAGSAVGAAVLSLHGGGRGADLLGWNRGDLLAIVATLAFAVSYLGRSWHGGSLNNQEITVLTLGVGAVCVALSSLGLGQGPPSVARPGSLWAAVAVAGALNCLNVFLVNYGFERLDAARAGNLLTLECVWGLGFGLLSYGQCPSIEELVGGAVIVGCAVGLNAEESAESPDARANEDIGRETTKSQRDGTAR
jgi:drug/metabolite transporter (DMT)-like permease